MANPPVVPVAIDALVQLLAAADGVDVRVYDGPETQWPDHADLVAVGLAPENLANPAPRDVTSLRSRGEQADITCVARAWTAGSRMKPCRDRAYALFTAAVEAVEADQTLGGVVSRAEVTGSIYVPSRPPKGLYAEVVFTVRVRQF